jgi:hypothetical protein
MGFECRQLLVNVFLLVEAEPLIKQVMPPE